MAFRSLTPNFHNFVTLLLVMFFQITLFTGGNGLAAYKVNRIAFHLNKKVQLFPLFLKLDFYVQCFSFSLLTLGFYAKLDFNSAVVKTALI